MIVNGIGAEGANVLSEMLKVNTTLKELRLDGEEEERREGERKERKEE